MESGKFALLSIEIVTHHGQHSVERFVLTNAAGREIRMTILGRSHRITTEDDPVCCPIRWGHWIGIELDNDIRTSNKWVIGNGPDNRSFVKYSESHLVCLRHVALIRQVKCTGRIVANSYISKVRSASFIKVRTLEGSNPISENRATRVYRPERTRRGVPAGTLKENAAGSLLLLARVHLNDRAYRSRMARPGNSQFPGVTHAWPHARLFPPR
jgi:hypothetical protein